MDRYIETAWAVVVRDEPSYPGDPMKEVLWNREEADRMRAKGYAVFPLYSPEPEPACDHRSEDMHYTGDGIEVSHCRECGRNELTGHRLPDSGEFLPEARPDDKG